MAISLEPSVRIVWFLDTIFPGGCPNCRWHHHIGINVTMPLWCHQHWHLHSEGPFGQQNGLTVNQTIWKDTPFCFRCTSSVHKCSLVVLSCPPLWKKQSSYKPESFTHTLPPRCIMKEYSVVAYLIIIYSTMKHASIFYDWDTTWVILVVNYIACRNGRPSYQLTAGAVNETIVQQFCKCILYCMGCKSWSSSYIIASKP